MITVPPAYVRVANDGDTRYIWISPDEFSGAYLHPAFVQSEGPIYWGKYLSGAATADRFSISQANSRPDYYPGCLTPPNTVTLTNADWLETGADGAHKGWHVMSIYDRALMALLMAIDYLSFNVGQYMNGVTVTSTLNSDETRVSWRNIVNAFLTRISGPTSAVYDTGEVVQGLLGGLTTASSDYKLGDPANLSTPVLVPGFSVSGDYSNKSVSIGSFLGGFSQELNCDIDLLFLPGSTGTATGASAIGANANTAVNVIRGQYYPNNANSLCFLGTTGSASSWYGMRIAKWTKS
jgi:hypothetical protein